MKFNDKNKLVVLMVMLLTWLASQHLFGQAVVTPAEARAIAKEAYIYGNPLVDSYRILYSYIVNQKDAEFKAPWNHIKNISRVYTHEDKAVQSPNSDTPYSFLGLDLRTEPIVLTVPQIEKNRYFSIQLIDLYTHNFEYVGSRTTGNDGGHYLITGPRWKGELPDGIKKQIRCETDLALAIFRTQLFDPDDIENVKAIQTGYKVQPLSSFLSKPAPKAAPTIDFIEPLTRDELTKSPKVFAHLNFVLQFCPTHQTEQDLMARFAKINIGAGKTFDWDEFSPEMQAAISGGIADAWDAFAELKTKVDAGEVGSGAVFGTREHLNNNYLYRMGGAVLGIWGNSEAEAIYPTYTVDSNGQNLDGSRRYILRFALGELPPVNSFWSLTMYALPETLLVDNPLNRYLINSTMEPDFVRDEEGGITLYLQHESPGKNKEANWLPAPKGAFVVTMRLYWPKAEALNGTWKQPPLTHVQ